MGLKLNFVMIHKEKKKGGSNKDSDDEEEEAGGNENNGQSPMSGFDYLLKMPIHSLTAEKVAQILQQKEDKEHELNLLRSKPIKEMWREDLDTLEKEIEAHEAEEQGIIAKEKKLMKKKRGQTKLKPTPKKERPFVRKQM